MPWWPWSCNGADGKEKTVLLPILLKFISLLNTISPRCSTKTRIDPFYRDRSFLHIINQKIIMKSVCLWQRAGICLSFMLVLFFQSSSRAQLTLSPTDIQKALEEAYNKFKDLREG